MEPRIRFFHEDDFCQQQFLPLAAWGHCASEIERIHEFSEAHKTPYGWTGAYVRTEPPAPLSSLGLTLAALADAAAHRLPPFDGVSTGWSTHEEEAQDVRAFGEDNGLALFAQVSPGGIIEALWMDPWGVERSKLDVMVDVLAGVPRADDLLFVDWAWGWLFPAAKREAWSDYLAKHLPQPD